jgi:phage head maturation protease
METKTFKAPLGFKADGDKGEFEAVFATLNVIDWDGDVTLPGAFGEQRVLLEAWNHNYAMPPVGKGQIFERENEAIVAGRFFMDTSAGAEHYTVAKELGEMQEFSYTFNILDAAPGVFDGQTVRFLKRLEVIGVGQVSRGAGIATRLTAIKSAEEKPYPNEHACRLRDPADFEAGSFRRTTREHEGKTYSVIMARLEGEAAMTEQAYRYPKDDWTADEARAHCRDHDGTFEAASNEDEAQSAGKSSVDIITMIDLLELTVIKTRLEGV